MFCIGSFKSWFDVNILEFEMWFVVGILNFKISIVVDILTFFGSANFWLLFGKIQLLFFQLSGHTGIEAVGA